MFYTRARTNVGTFECLFMYVIFASRVSAPKNSLIVFMPDLYMCKVYTKSHFIAVSQ